MSYVQSQVCTCRIGVAKHGVLMDVERDLESCVKCFLKEGRMNYRDEAPMRSIKIEAPEHVHLP